MCAVAVTLLVLVVAFYAAVATAYGEARRHREPAPRWARIVGPVSVAVHLAGLFLLSHQMARSPFANGSQALSFLAFALAGSYLLLEATSRVASHGAGFYAVAACLTALSVPGLIDGDPAAWAAGAPDPLRSLHVGLSLLCAAAVLAGGLLGVSYLGTYRRVKHGSLLGLDGEGRHGPSLRGFERLSRVASLLAVVLLLPSAVLGVYLAEHTGTGPNAGVIILSAPGFLLLLLLTGSSFLWWFRPRRGALASWLNLIAAVLLVLAFVVAHPLLIGRAS